jgi:hypothetical protein
MVDFLSKERIVAPPGFNRWLVPPAALAIHLSIGMAYGFSVFWLPLSRAIGIVAPAPADWKITSLGWMYTLFFVFLGSSAAVFGAADDVASVRGERPDHTDVQYDHRNRPDRIIRNIQKVCDRQERRHGDSYSECFHEGT